MLQVLFVHHTVQMKETTIIKIKILNAYNDNFNCTVFIPNTKTQERNKKLNIIGNSVEIIGELLAQYRLW